uniref:Solute carrier family 38, member 4 n=1 Tax=Nothobranchius kuhntae TaxID=321403 RepID=A0A1A8IM52_NOTKU
MPKVRDHMELKRVPTEADDDSTTSLDREPIDSEKATITSSQFLDDNDDGEDQRFLSNGIPMKKKYDDEEFPGHASFGMSVFNLSNAIMGSGILGLSYAMANTGIVLFTILLIAVAILSSCSHVQLPLYCEYELPEVIRAFMGLEEISGEWYLNGNYLVVFVSLGVILPLSLLKNLGYLGYTSGFSLSCMVFFLTAVIYKKTQLPCPLPFFYGPSSNLSMNSSDMSGLYVLRNSSTQMDFSRADVSPVIHSSQNTPHSTGVRFEPHPSDEEMCTPKYFVFNSQTAYTIPILAFAFVCHPEVLPIYSELKDRTPKKMQTVSNLSILAMLIMYMLSALFGYLTFYENVEAELLHTFTKVYKFDTLLLLVRLAVLTAVTLTVPIVLFPIRSSITTLLFSGRDFSWIRHMVIAAAILLFNNMLVIFVPTIRDIFGFIGGSAATMLIFILPAAFYLRLVKPRSTPKKVGATVFLIMGIVFMFGSLSLITLDWIHNPPGSKGH